MKTVLIYVDWVDQRVHYIVLNGDHRHLDGVNLGIDFEPLSPEVDKIQKQLNKLLYKKNGDPKLKPVVKFPFEEVKNGAFVIQAGLVS